MKSKKQTFPATLLELPQIMTWVRERIGATSLDPKQKKEVEIALEEAIVNVIKHARPMEEISLESTHTLEQEIAFILSDSGHPFNPLTYQHEPDRESPLQERKPGGLGLVFMRKYMDSLIYRRENNRNILTLIKRI